MRVGIVGCGFVARKHLAALRSADHVTVVGLCDRQRALAEELARSFSMGDVFDDIDQLIQKTRPDVLHILTPPQSHHALALQAFHAGCDVMVEKPMAQSVDEAESMVAAARRSGRRLAVCHNYLYVPAFIKARRAIDDGELGQVLSADIYWRMSSYGPGDRVHATGWMHDLPGGVFQEVLPHLVYLLAAVMGRLQPVAVLSGDRQDGRDHELRILFETDRGPAMLALSLRANPVQKVLRLYGTGGTLHVDLATSVTSKLSSTADRIADRAWVNVSHSAQLAVGTIANTLRVLGRQLPRSHERMIHAFYHARRRGDPTPVTGEDGLATVTVLDQIWRLLQREPATRVQPPL